MSPMSPWGDILTEQLRGDILIDQQHCPHGPLTGQPATEQYRANLPGVFIVSRGQESVRTAIAASIVAAEEGAIMDRPPFPTTITRRDVLKATGTAAAGLAIGAG